ncbi:hypothetical protein Q5752_006445 [Cryptotrichosporon argae]
MVRSRQTTIHAHFSRSSPASAPRSPETPLRLRPLSLDLSDGEVEGADEGAPVVRRPRARARAAVRRGSDSDSEGEEGLNRVHFSAERPVRTQRGVVLSDGEDGEDEDEDEVEAERHEDEGAAGRREGEDEGDEDKENVPPDEEDDEADSDGPPESIGTATRPPRCVVPVDDDDDEAEDDEAENGAKTAAVPAAADAPDSGGDDSDLEVDRLVTPARPKTSGGHFVERPADPQPVVLHDSDLDELHSDDEAYVPPAGDEPAEAAEDDEPSMMAGRNMGKGRSQTAPRPKCIGTERAGRGTPVVLDLPLPPAGSFGKATDGPAPAAALASAEAESSSRPSSRQRLRVDVVLSSLSQEEKARYRSITPTGSGEAQKAAPTRGRRLEVVIASRAGSQAAIPAMAKPTADKAAKKNDVPQVHVVEDSDDAVSAPTAMQGSRNTSLRPATSSRRTLSSITPQPPIAAGPSRPTRTYATKRGRLRDPSIYDSFSDEAPKTKKTKADGGKSKRRAPTPLDSDSNDIIEVRRRSSSVRRGTARRVRDPDDSDDEEAMTASDDSLAEELQTRSRKTQGGGSKPEGKSRADSGSKVKLKVQRRARVADPDEDIANELEMEEPERFKTKSRLRERRSGRTGAGSAWSKLFARNRRRAGGLDTTSDTSDVEGITSGSGSDSGKSADDGGVVVDEDDFIATDDDDIADVVLPPEFSFAQTPEYMFKVVFQYMLLLVIKGPDILPLQGTDSEYFMRPLHELRSRMTGLRDLRVRSQIWKDDFVKALKTFPDYVASHLDEYEQYCNACNRNNQRCYHHVRLEGDPYDPETHEKRELAVESETETESEDSDDSAPLKKRKKQLRQEFNMGRHCFARAQAYHNITHWEDELFYRVRNYYRDLLRAKGKLDPESDSELDSADDWDDNTALGRAERLRAHATQRRKTAGRIDALKRRKLPPKVKDVDVVTEWMDSMGYQIQEYRWFEEIEVNSRKLEFDHMKDS